MYAQQHCSVMDTEKLGTGNLGNGNREHPRSHIPSSSFLSLQSIKLVIIRQQQHWGLYIFGSILQNECTDSTGVQNEFTRRCLETRYNSCLLVHLDFEERQQTRRSFLMNHYTKHQNHWSSESHSLTCLAFMKHPLIQYNTSVPKNQLKFDIFATCQFFTTIVTQTFWNKDCLDIFSLNILLSYLLVSFLIFIIWNADITIFPTFSCR